MILRLGHCELGVLDLEAARTFYVDVLGFVHVLSEPGRVYLRGTDEFDLWTLALTEGLETGLGHAAFRVDSPKELDRLERQHQQLGVRTSRARAGTEPGQGESLRVQTPDGYPIEFYHDMEQIAVYDAAGGARLPMRSTHRQKGIPPNRIDHINIRTKDVEESLRYWRDELDFSVSEYVVDEQSGREQVVNAWIRRKPGSHDVALVKKDGPGMHHVAYYLNDALAVVKAADLLVDAGYPQAIEFGPGRHGVSNACFLYLRDPSGNRLEVYGGDYIRDLDLPPIRWSKPQFIRQGLLWWGSAVPERFFETTPVNANWPSQELKQSMPAAVSAMSKE